jgi:hypothetical protein
MRQRHSLLLPLAWEGTTLGPATTQAIMQSTVILGPTAWERFSSRTPIEHARAHSLTLSTHVTCSPWHIKGRVGVLSKGQGSSLFNVTSSFFSREEPLFFNLQPAMASTNYRDLGSSSLSCPFVPLLQISANNTTTRTGRRVLLSGGPYQYKSCVPPFAQPFEARHAIREIYCRRLEKPDTRLTLELSECKVCQPCKGLRIILVRASGE